MLLLQGYRSWFTSSAVYSFTMPLTYPIPSTICRAFGLPKCILIRKCPSCKLPFSDSLAAQHVLSLFIDFRTNSVRIQGLYCQITQNAFEHIVSVLNFFPSQTSVQCDLETSDWHMFYHVARLFWFSWYHTQYVCMSVQIHPLTL